MHGLSECLEVGSRLASPSQRVGDGNVRTASGLLAGRTCLPEGEKRDRKSPVSPLAGHSAPWVPDAAADRCKLCSTPFTMLFRRHHCRQCGTLVCGSCSSHKSWNGKDSSSFHPNSSSILVSSQSHTHSLLLRSSFPQPPYPRFQREARSWNFGPSRISFPLVVLAQTSVRFVLLSRWLCSHLMSLLAPCFRGHTLRMEPSEVFVSAHVVSASMAL